MNTTQENCGDLFAATPKPTPKLKTHHGNCDEYKLMKLRETPTFGVADTPEKVAAFYEANIKTSPMHDPLKETFWVIFLNTRRVIVGFTIISIGTLDTLLVHAREVYRPAIVAGSHAIVLLHSHPSGDPSPSEADIKVTRDLIRAGQLLKIDVLDHVITGDLNEGRTKNYISLREIGFFYS